VAITASTGPDLSAHGLASPSLRREIERQALAVVVSPCAAALLGGRAALAARSTALLAPPMPG
jgi:hypothetical protein